MSTRQRSWPVPVALVALSAIPLVVHILLAADLAKGAGWGINLAVAELALRRPARRRLALSTAPQRAGALG